MEGFIGFELSRLTFIGYHKCCSLKAQMLELSLLCGEGQSWI